MTTLTVKYNKIFASMEKDDEDTIQMLDIMDKYQVEFLNSNEINSLTEDIETQQILYGYST